MARFLQAGQPFEIRCWRDEPEIIAQAARLGSLCDAQCTDYEVSITGILTDAIIQEILEYPKPEADGQMTPFFTINIGERFSSAHSGTEIYISGLEEDEVEQIHAILAPVQDCMTWRVWDADEIPM